MALLTPLGNLPYPQPARRREHPRAHPVARGGRRRPHRAALRGRRDPRRQGDRPGGGHALLARHAQAVLVLHRQRLDAARTGPVHKANTTAGTTTSTAYVETLTGSTGDPTTVTFTAPASGAVLVSVGARISSSAATACHMSANIRLNTTVALAAADTRAALVVGTNQCSATTQFQVTGLTVNGVYTATAAYKSAATTSTATFANRFITVTPVM